MSARLSGVRSSGSGRRAVTLRRSLSDAHQLPHFRRDAAAWIEEMLGVAVPAGSDDEFRAALADGVYLCQILNALKPRTVHHVRHLLHLAVDQLSSLAVDILQRIIMSCRCVPVRCVDVMIHTGDSRIRRKVGGSSSRGAEDCC